MLTKSIFKTVFQKIDCRFHLIDKLNVTKEWIIKQPERQLVLFGSDAFMFTCFAVFFAVLLILILCTI